MVNTARSNGITSGKCMGRARFFAADSGSEKVSREEENGNE